ncbi:MAG: hypothetical protein ABSH13_21570 [Candidatus Acidiferrum sp.]
MSYIAALRCREGGVLVADTQETYGDEKQYTEKLAVSPDRLYPLAVGGAGIDVITDAFPQELLERVTADPPNTKHKLIKMVREAIREVYASDVPLAVLSAQERTAEFLVAAKPRNDNFVMLRLRGKRVYEVTEDYAIVGFATAANKALLKRMYRENLTMHRAVLLASFLVSQSKVTDAYVGGSTRIALVAEIGASFEDRTHVANIEKRASDFLELMDDLFFNCADLTSRDVDFANELEICKQKLLNLRQEHKRITASRFFSEPDRMAEVNWHPYPYLLDEFVLKIGLDKTTFSEEEQDLSRMREMVKDVKEKVKDNKSEP